MVSHHIDDLRRIGMNRVRVCPVSRMNWSGYLAWLQARGGGLFAAACMRARLATWVRFIVGSRFHNARDYRAKRLRMQAISWGDFHCGWYVMCADGG